jgi:hypothetical protein
MHRQEGECSENNIDCSLYVHYTLAFLQQGWLLKLMNLKACSDLICRLTSPTGHTEKILLITPLS